MNKCAILALAGTAAAAPNRIKTLRNFRLMLCYLCAQIIYIKCVVVFVFSCMSLFSAVQCMHICMFMHKMAHRNVENKWQTCDLIRRDCVESIKNDFLFRCYCCEVAARPTATTTTPEPFCQTQYIYYTHTACHPDARCLATLFYVSLLLLYRMQTLALFFFLSSRLLKNVCKRNSTENWMRKKKKTWIT